MTSGIYDTDRTTIVRPVYQERALLMAERFYPGEFGWVIVLSVASLLLYSLAIWGLTSDTHLLADKNLAYNTDYSYSMYDTNSSMDSTLTNPDGTTTTTGSTTTTTPPSAY
jgi:hypothetical protein